MLGEKGTRTLPIHGELDLADGAIVTKDFAQVVFVDVLGELFYDDLWGLVGCVGGAVRLVVPLSFWVVRLGELDRASSFFLGSGEYLVQGFDFVKGLRFCLVHCAVDGGLYLKVFWSAKVIVVKQNVVESVMG